MMNEDLLQTLQSGDTELFTMPDLSGQPVRIEVQRIIEQLDGDWSLTGHIDGNWMDSFFLSVSGGQVRSEEHTSELQSRGHLVCRLLLEKKKNTCTNYIF